jgi:DNA-binding response OmpR family regulator
VLVVSARRDLATRLAALRAGACDFVVKPFAFDELVERVAIHLRAVERPVDPVLRAGSLVLDVRSREVHLAGGSVKLSEREFSLLEQLARHHGHVVSRERLLSAVWGYSFRSGTNALDVCVNRLRHKLGARHIETVRSAGYRLVG